MQDNAGFEALIHDVRQENSCSIRKQNVMEVYTSPVLCSAVHMAKIFFKSDHPAILVMIEGWDPVGLSSKSSFYSRSNFTGFLYILNFFI